MNDFERINKSAKELLAAFKMIQAKRQIVGNNLVITQGGQSVRLPIRRQDTINTQRISSR